MKMKRWYWLAVMVMVLGPATMLVKGEYAIFDLGRVDYDGVEDQGEVYKINDAGLVVGAVTNSNSKSRPAIWEKSGNLWTKTELPIIAGTYYALSGEAIDVNASGKVVGWSSALGTWYPHACTWQKVGGVWQVTDLGGDNALRSKGYGINDNGVVVGYKEISAWANRCTIWEDGVATNIGGDISSGPWAKINSAGTWIAARLSEPYHLAVWEKAGGSWQPPTDLGTVGGNYSEPRQINDAGQIVGLSWNAAGNPVPFLYTNEVMQDLGTFGGLEGEALGINDAGVAVGFAQLASGDPHAFIYQNGVLTDLNTQLPAGSSWELTKAGGINNDGWIAGVGKLNGESHAFVMYPASPLSGTIEFEDYTGSVNVLVQVDVTRNGSTTSYDVVIPAGGGQFSLPNLTAGTYNIRFKACTWQSVELTVPVIGPTELPPITLSNGDGTGDGTVTTADLTAVMTNMDQTGM